MRVSTIDNVLVLFLIGRESGARLFNQSQSETKANDYLVIALMVDSSYQAKVAFEH